jgi:hypothetical protein
MGNNDVDGTDQNETKCQNYFHLLSYFKAICSSSSAIRDEYNNLLTIHEDI